MIILLDTETTGFMPAGYKSGSYAHPQAPYLVELAVIKVNLAGEEVGRMQRVVKPEGWIIPQAAAAVHGITTEIAHAEGVPLRTVYEEFEALVGEDTTMAVAHNMSYDAEVLGVAEHRSQVPTRFASLRHVCTKLAFTALCGLTNRSGGKKWPKLEEIHQRLFGRGFSGAHRAMADTEALTRVFLVGREFVPELAFHHPGGLKIYRKHGG